MTAEDRQRRNLDYYRQQMLVWITQRVCKRYTAVILVSLALAVASVVYTVNCLTFKTNRNDLVRSGSETHELFLAYMREFRQDEDFIIVINSPDKERNKECLFHVAEQLKQHSDLFPHIFYRIDFSSLEDRMLLYLEPEQLRRIETSQEQFAEVIEKLGPSQDLLGLLKKANEMMDPDRLQEEGEFEKMQPFLNSFIQNLTQLGDYLEGKRRSLEGISEIFTEGTELGDMAAQRDQHEFVSFENGRIFLLLIRPMGEPTEFTRFDRPLKVLREIVRETRGHFPGVNIGLTGEPALDNDEMAASANDSMKASILTLALISLLFMVSYRETTRPLLAVCNLIVATAWTLGFTTLAVGHLNILTVTFVVMILGLGIDYGIQILGRYEEELSHGARVEDALVTTFQHTGNAILTGAIVTAVGFFTMTLNEFIGLAELGIIAGGGIILTFISTITFLGALLMWRERRRPPTKDLRYHFGFQRTAEIEREALKYPWIILAVAAVITFGAALSALKVHFDYNLLHLQSKRLDSVRYERLLIRSASRSTIFGAVICSSLPAAREMQARLRELPSVSDVVGPPDFVPLNQEAKFPLIENIKKKLGGINFKVDDLPRVNLGAYMSELAKLRDKMKTYSKFADLADEKEAAEIFAKLIPPMDRVLKCLHKLPMAEAEHKLTSYQNHLLPEIQEKIEWLRNQRTGDPITLDDIPTPLRQRYIGKTGKLLLEVFPKENVWERPSLKRFVADLRSVAPDATGTPVQLYYYVDLLKTSYQKAAVYALLAISFMIFLHFRSISATLLTLVPLAIGCVWTLGWMHVHALQFNPANIIALPLSVGIGIAFGVYLVDRYRETGEPDSFSNSTGGSILLSALTTMIGFGSLITANHEGISTLGQLMTANVGLCMLSALVVMPPLLEIFRRRGWKL